MIDLVWEKLLSCCSIPEGWNGVYMSLPRRKGTSFIKNDTPLLNGID